MPGSLEGELGQRQVNSSPTLPPHKVRHTGGCFVTVTLRDPPGHSGYLLGVMDAPPPLLSPRCLADSSERRRSWVDYTILMVVILLAFVALRYLDGAGGVPLE